MNGILAARFVSCRRAVDFRKFFPKHRSSLDSIASALLYSLAWWSGAEGILAWERTENGCFSTPIGGRHGKEEGQEGEEEEQGEEEGSCQEEGKEEVSDGLPVSNRSSARHVA